MNIVILSGLLSSAPRRTELPSGDIRWALELTTPLEAGGATDPAASVPVAWHGELVAGRACIGDAASWVAGTELVVVGAVRRRFYRAGGVTQSRTEVLAMSLVEVTRRRPVEASLRKAAQVLGPGSAAALRSGVGVLSPA
ncbi:MAG: hypothetical protein WD023_09515 [Ilumatobacteraceae bacterium]